ncbi:MAG: hypothetical protein EOO39_06715, partial [Cytophagaceae bacterium]
MFRSYLTLAFRQLWRNRLYTSLNVLGLAIGLSACWVIFQIVSFEFSFDRNHPNGDRLYRVVSRLDIDGEDTGQAGVPKPLAGAIESKVAGIDLTVPFQKLYEQSYPNSIAGLSVKLPIFQGTRRIQNLRREQLESKRLDLDVVNLRNQINTQHEQAMASYKSSLNDWRTAKENVRLSEEVYNTIKLQY